LKEHNFIEKLIPNFVQFLTFFLLQHLLPGIIFSAKSICKDSASWKRKAWGGRKNNIRRKTGTNHSSRG